MSLESKWCEVRPVECNRKCEFCNTGLTKTNSSKNVKHKNKSKNGK